MFSKMSASFGLALVLICQQARGDDCYNILLASLDKLGITSEQKLDSELDLMFSHDFEYWRNMNQKKEGGGKLSLIGIFDISGSGAVTKEEFESLREKWRIDKSERNRSELRVRIMNAAAGEAARQIYAICVGSRFYHEQTPRNPNESEFQIALHYRADEAGPTELTLNKIIPLNATIGQGEFKEGTHLRAGGTITGNIVRTSIAGGTVTLVFDHYSYQINLPAKPSQTTAASERRILLQPTDFFIPKTLGARGDHDPDAFVQFDARVSLSISEDRKRIIATLKLALDEVRENPNDHGDGSHAEGIWQGTVYDIDEFGAGGTIQELLVPNDSERMVFNPGRMTKNSLVQVAGHSQPYLINRAYYVPDTDSKEDFGTNCGMMVWFNPIRVKVQP